ncbi:MAG: cyclic nucleotide-binding/CBS domain-containing protein [Halobacteriales archaeon]
MDEPVTVRDVIHRSYVGVSESDSVAGAAELMLEEGVHSAVVLRGSDPIGVLDETRLLDVVANIRDPTATTAGDVMRPAVSVEADERLEEAITAMATDGLRHLLVEEDGEVIASVSDHDIVTAYSVMGTRSEPASEHTPGPPEPEMVVENELESDVYSTQGVCESCGTLTAELSNHNGQLLCSDCIAL